jgi:hypothetical protein
VLRLLAEIEAGRSTEAPPEPAESLPTPVARLPHEGDALDVPAAAVKASKGGRARRRRFDRSTQGRRR